MRGTWNADEWIWVNYRDDSVSKASLGDISGAESGSSTVP
jgi:hypothetical protein